MLYWVGSCTSGGEPSNVSAFPSSPLVWSKKIPYAARIDVFPFPKGSQARPMRGAGLKRSSLIQARGTPATPHWTIPSKGLVPGLMINAPAAPVRFPVVSIVGAWLGSYAAGSQLKTCRLISRKVPKMPTRNPRLRVRFLRT